MQVFEAFLNKKWQAVMWHRKCEQSIHVQQPRGLGLGGKSGQDFFPEGQGQGQGQDLRCQGQGPDLVIQAQGQDLHEVSLRILEAEAEARPQGQ